MIVEMIVLVCKGCHVYSVRDLQNKYKLKEIRFTYDDPPNHAHRPTSKKPFKLRFAGMPMMAQH